MSEICPTCGRDYGKWEYKVYFIPLESNTATIEKELNKLAAQNWRPVRWLSDFPLPWARHMILERPKQDAPLRFDLEES